MNNKNFIEMKSFLVGFLCGILIIISYFFYYQPIKSPSEKPFDFSNAEFFDDNMNPAIQILEQNNSDVDDNDNQADQTSVTLPQEQLFDLLENDIVKKNNTNHKFYPLNQKTFHTPQERKDFFDKMGLIYCNKTKLEYLPIVDIDPRLSEKYSGNAEYHDLLTEVYAKDIESQTLMPMSIRWISPEVGHGIFAEDDLPIGGFVGIYGGLVREKSLVTNKDYAWSYPGTTAENEPISLDALTYRNELAFVNDGKDPNCVVQYIIGPDNLWHVCYLAIKDIKKGEQLLVSYGNAYWDTRQYGYQNLAE